VRNRSRPRRSAVHWASTIPEAGTFDAPNERIFTKRGLASALQ
jgi:hypothetical protein